MVAPYKNMSEGLLRDLSDSSMLQKHTALYFLKQPNHLNRSSFNCPEIKRNWVPEKELLIAHDRTFIYLHKKCAKHLH